MILPTISRSSSLSDSTHFSNSSTTFAASARSPSVTAFYMRALNFSAFFSTLWQEVADIITTDAIAISSTFFIIRYFLSRTDSAPRQC